MCGTWTFRCVNSQSYWASASVAYNIVKLDTFCMQNTPSIHEWLGRHRHRELLSLNIHWRDHRREFPNLRTAEEYETRANEFVNSFQTDASIEYLWLRDYSVELYNPVTNELGIIGSEGDVIVTYFRPEAKARYWLRERKQQALWGTILEDGYGGAGHT